MGRLVGKYRPGKDISRNPNALQLDDNFIQNWWYFEVSFNPFRNCSETWTGQCSLTILRKIGCTPSKCNIVALTNSRTICFSFRRRIAFWVGASPNNHVWSTNAEAGGMYQCKYIYINIYGCISIHIYIYKHTWLV